MRTMFAQRSKLKPSQSGASGASIAMKKESRAIPGMPLFMKRDIAIQAKLTVNPANDAYEQEADRVADHVTSVSNTPATVQRKCDKCEQEENIQRKPLVNLSIQRQAEPQGLFDRNCYRRTFSGVYETRRNFPFNNIGWQLIHPGACTECEGKFYIDCCEHDDHECESSSAESTSVQQKSESASGSVAQPSMAGVESTLASKQGSGSLLPDPVKGMMESRMGYDLNHVRIHTDQDAVQLNRTLGAQAFTHDENIFFGAGKFNPHSTSGHHLLAHELTHVIQQNSSTNSSIQRECGVDESCMEEPNASYAPEEPNASYAPEEPNAPYQESETSDDTESVPPTEQQALERMRHKEVQKDSEIRGKQDWTTADRESNTKRWQDACLTNLNAVDSSQYVKVVERRDFYKWFYEYTASRGYTTRWALAAYVVANGAHQIADMDVDHAIANDTFGLANVELQGAMREGNQVIFDNVLPKLKKLLDGGSLNGRAALDWDMQVLAEEQTLIQPMYSRMSEETVKQLDYIARKKRIAGFGAWWSGDDKIPKGTYNNADTVPGFDQLNIQDIGDRWKYGMNLGDMFTPGGSGFDPNKNTMPAVGIGYQDGSEFAKVDTRAHLHELDAWLNPNRFTRMGPGSLSAITYIQTIINKLSAFEKLQILSDQSPDGWAYSTEFAQFGAVTEAMVKQALPSEPSFAGAVAAFLSRYKTERTQIELKYPTPMYFPMKF